jgi:hypothetical protein
MTQLNNTQSDFRPDTELFTGKTRGKGFFSTKNSIDHMPSVMKSLDVSRHYNHRTPESQIDFSSTA